MREAGGGLRRGLSYGCFGCLAVLAAGILAAAVLTVVGVFQVRSEQSAEHTLTHAIPAPTEGSAEAGDTAPTRVVLDLSDAEFRVRPADPGEGLRVEARFDENSYALEEGWTGDPTEDSGVYRVSFRRTGSAVLAMVRSLLGGSRPRVDIRLPSGAPVDLDLVVARGAAEVDLGGLWLTSAELSAERGGFEVRFSEPLREPVERLTLRASMGGFSFSEIGNASPRRLDVDFSYGGGLLDFSGNWTGDSTISVRARRCGLAFQLPSGPRIRGLAAWGGPEDLPSTPQPEIPPATLDFELDLQGTDLKIGDGNQWSR